MSQSDQYRLLNRSEVADKFGIPKRYLELSALRGTGPRMVRFGRLVRYRVRDIEDWIEANTTQDEPN